MAITLSNRALRVTFFLAFFLLITIYALYRSHDLIFGIKIKNVSINNIMAENISELNDNIVEVKGNAKNAVNLTLNGREISINENGDFDETFVLLSGYNVLDIEGKDKFGYVDEKNYKIIYD